MAVPNDKAPMEILPETNVFFAFKTFSWLSHHRIFWYAHFIEKICLVSLDLHPIFFLSSISKPLVDVGIMNAPIPKFFPSISTLDVKDNTDALLAFVINILPPLDFIIIAF